jgi:hypothetical protein
MLPGQIAVVGGNIQDSVTMTYVPVTAQGLLATADGAVLDRQFPWMAVLRLLIDEPVPPNPL